MSTDNHLVCVPPSYLDDVPGITAKVAIDAATTSFGCDEGEGHILFGTRVQVRFVISAHFRCLHCNVSSLSPHPTIVTIVATRTLAKHASYKAGAYNFFRQNA